MKKGNATLEFHKKVEALYWGYYKGLLAYEGLQAGIREAQEWYSRKLEDSTTTGGGEGLGAPVTADQVALLLYLIAVALVVLFFYVLWKGIE